MKKEIQNGELVKQLVGNPCEVKTLDEAKKLCKELGFSRRDKVPIHQNLNAQYGPDDGPYFIDSKFRHVFAFTWAEKVHPEDKEHRLHNIYGMPRCIDRELIEIMYIRCNSQRWFFRIAIGHKTNKVLEVVHATNGRPVNKTSLKDMFGYTFWGNEFGENFGSGADFKCFITSDGYFFACDDVDRRVVKDLKTYKNLREYEKMLDI